MSSISKASSRSSSSGFSSIINEPILSTISLQTILTIRRVDIYARHIFCGEQDSRLNELRRITGAIIDLNVIQDTKHPFERVNWTISHRDTEIRDFVVRRLNHWMKQTQLICDMAYEDSVFLQEKQTTKKPPLSTANFGRRNRTRSLTQSDGNSLRSNVNYAPSTPSVSSRKQEVPFTGLLGRTLKNLEPNYNDCQRLFTPQKKTLHTEKTFSSRTTDNAEITPTEIRRLTDAAKNAGLLSDTSENELNENRVCFADTVSLSKLAEMLRNNELKSTSKIHEIVNVIQQSTMNVTTREEMRHFSDKKYWFCRVLLDDHIQFPVGISSNASQARRLAYQNMISVCLNSGGVKMKVLIGNRVKVDKGPKLDEQNHCNATELDMNATYISTADLSCLSQCKITC